MFAGSISRRRVNTCSWGRIRQEPRHCCLVGMHYEKIETTDRERRESRLGSCEKLPVADAGRRIVMSMGHPSSRHRGRCVFRIRRIFCGAISRCFLVRDRDNLRPIRVGCRSCRASRTDWVCIFRLARFRRNRLRTNDATIHNSGALFCRFRRAGWRIYMPRVSRNCLRARP